VGLAALVIVLVRRRRQEPDDSSSKPSSKYKAAGGETDSDPTSMAYITMSSDPATGSSKEQDLKVAGAQAGLGRIGSPKAQATGQATPQGGAAAPARTRPTTIVLPKSAAALLDAIDVSSGLLFAPGAASDVVPPTAARSGPKNRAQQLAMIEKELKEIRTNLQVDDPGADAGQKGKQPQGSGGQSSSISSSDEVGSTGSDWIQAGAALTDHIPGLMLTAVLG
jgi:hypothetical protein